MKKITLENVAQSLREMKYEVVVAEEVASKALRAIDAMLKV